MTQRVMVTGANGYVGRALSHRLCVQLAEGDIDTLTLVDQHDADDDTLRESLPSAVRGQLHQVIGDLRDPDTLSQALAQRPDRVFHLAGITSRQAEDDFALGLAVNVDAAMALFEHLRQQELCPVLVFASSCGVYGPSMPSVIDDATVPAPCLSYGSQKLMMEILLSDYSRRGWLDARSVRLPSVVARPAPRSAAASSFASDLIRETALGRRYLCPVGPDASLWLLSLPGCVTQLLHAAGLPAQALPPTRAWNLPALRATVDDVVRAMAKRLGCDPDSLVHYQPQPAMQAQFAQWPALSTSTAHALGFTHDSTLERLLDSALAQSSPATFHPTLPIH